MWPDIVSDVYTTIPVITDQHSNISIRCNIYIPCTYAIACKHITTLITFDKIILISNVVTGLTISVIDNRGRICRHIL